MQSRINALWRGRIGRTLFLIVAVSLMAFGCASSSPGSYKLGFQGTAPKFNTSTWTIEHNLFGGTGQRADKEDWEEDWPS
jgi:hypothetical protein